MRLKTRITKIQTLVELAEIEEEKAAKTFAELQGQYKQHLEQLEALHSYVNEYNLSGGTSQVLQPIQVLSTQAFLDKLRHAIQAESERTETLLATVERAREVWFEKRTRLQALQKLVEKLQNSHRTELDRKEQRFLDELASQSFNSRSIKGGR